MAVPVMLEPTRCLACRVEGLNFFLSGVNPLKEKRSLQGPFRGSTCFFKLTLNVMMNWRCLLARPREVQEEHHCRVEGAGVYSRNSRVV